MEIFEMEKEFNDLMKAGQALLEKMKENHIADDSKKVRWKPKDGETYYYVVSNGEIDYSFWMADATDEGRFNFGNVFKTEEEARKAIDTLGTEKLKLIFRID